MVGNKTKRPFVTNSVRPDTQNIEVRDEYNSIKHLDSKTHLCIFIGLSVKSTFDLDTKYGRAF